ncbi:EAL domain-containing protein [Holosporaceae bacterium 'Namur']|nr:EAL domain-containing protein [Holosporaceae bacterium 'Namur']
MVLGLFRGGHNKSVGNSNNFSKAAFAEDSLNNISNFIKKKNTDKNILGIIQFQNLPVIIFSYGIEFSKVLAESITKSFYDKFHDRIHLEKISSDSLLFCIAENDEEEAYNTLREVFKALKTQSSQDAENPVYLCFNCGTSVLASSLEEAVNQAYMALFECKNKDGYVHYIYNEDISQKMLQHQNHMKLAAYFQRAIIENRLRLAFQPIIDSKTGKVKHHESLLRIVTEENKIISAGPFIPIAEAMRFIDQIDFLVLDLVVKELKFNPDVTLAMNISNLSIDNTEWLRKAKNLLKDYGIASRLIVEITETSMHRELSKVAYFVDTLQSLGCLVAIDDFGAGYTSFTQLKMIHADLIKIDGIFIRDIVDNHDSRLFVQTLLGFAHGFGIKTVAEFVETGEIAKTLIDLNIDYMQGNYFSPAVNYRTWIKDDVYKILN